MQAYRSLDGFFKTKNVVELYGMTITALVSIMRAQSLLCLILWGFFAHQEIHGAAVFSLPSPMLKFYKANINYLKEHAVEADKRRYVDSAEAARHYIDLDRYGMKPFDSIPKRWNDALAKYNERLLLSAGIIPWQIERTYRSLVRAFSESDPRRILKISADLGHYISDAHVPLHTTENYNGQLTGQQGIHGFWESRLPELFVSDYRLIVGPARYIENPLNTAWKILEVSFGHVDSVLLIEAALSSKFNKSAKYDFSARKGLIVKQYSKAFSTEYHQRLAGMVEERFRESILMTASYWYTAWLEAGQPDLNSLSLEKPKPDEKGLHRIIENAFRKGGIIGRQEN